MADGYVHPIAGHVVPARTSCNQFRGDGRSDLCLGCNRSYHDHSPEVMVRSGYSSWLDEDPPTA